jgi:hypothetical protein
MELRRWQAMNLETRYAAVHGPPPEPELPPQVVAIPLRSGDPSLNDEERAHQLRAAREMILLEAAAERAQRAETERRAKFRAETAVGQLFWR